MLIRRFILTQTFIQHKLDMKNDIHGSWCRTTPLWGRGLSLINSGAEDRLHDARARNEIEAIMWHAYSKNSQAYNAAVKFYKLPKLIEMQWLSSYALSNNFSK